MADGSEQRRHVRLPARGSSAEEFDGARTDDLPKSAMVSDVSEGGVGLRFSWPAGEEFPLSSDDGLAFRLILDGGQRQFDLMSVVRHVATDESTGVIRVGVEFSGLEGGVREDLKKAVTNMAVTALRTWSATQIFKKDQTPEAAAGLPRSETRRRKLFLGEILVKQGALKPERLDRFLSEEFSGQRRLGEELATRGLVDEVALAKALAEQSRLTYIDLDKTPPDMNLVARLSREEFTRRWALPVREEDGALLVAMSAPPDLETFSKMREEQGQRIRVGIAAAGQLADWLKRIYNLEGAPRPASMSFQVQLHAEYRLLSPDWKKPLDARPSVGLTTEVSHRSMIIAGPLPAGFTPERIAGEKLKMAVRISCRELSEPMAMGCTPVSVRASEYRGEYLLDCRIDRFPKNGEGSWTRLCLVRGTTRFHPGDFG